MQHTISKLRKCNLQINLMFSVITVAMTMYLNIYYFNFQYNTNGEKLVLIDDSRNEYSQKIVKKDYNYSYIASYDNWIRGIGDNYLWNNETNSNCLYPSIPFTLNKEYVINPDPLYNHIHSCDNYLFSKIYKRIITVDCKSKTLKYIEYNGIHHGVLKLGWDSMEWDIMHSNKVDTPFIIKLKEKTQSIWIGCNTNYNYHISLLPLINKNNTMYNMKKNKIKENFNNITPPNVVLFIVDSTSRSSFFRHATSTVKYLSTLQIDIDNKSPSNIFEFFRYSSIGWGTVMNLNGLLSGVCPYCQYGFKQTFKNCIGLATYYDNMGYYVLGLNEWRTRLNTTNQDSWNRKQNMAVSECQFYLTDRSLPIQCGSGGGTDIGLATKVTLNAINLQKTKDIHVPYFIVIHNQFNHVPNGNKVNDLDRYIRELVEYIDKDNTIIHIVGDHGSAFGDGVYSLYGKYEMTNPVSILMIPKRLRKYYNFNSMKINQQRHINHYDLHLFYKELLNKLSSNNNSWFINESLPRTKEGVILSKSIINNEMPVDRDCFGILDGFCFCDSLQSKQINDELLKNDKKYIELIIDTINNVTGNGLWHCNQLNPNDFTLKVHLENNEKNLTTKHIEIIIEKKVDDENKRLKLLKQNKLLSFSATLKRKIVDDIIEENFKIPIIERAASKIIPGIARIDHFKYEKCLTTNYNKHTYREYDEYFTKRDIKSTLEPIFIDINMTINMLKYSKMHNQLWNLRVCHCKNMTI